MPSTCAQIVAAVDQQKRGEDLVRRKKPLVRIWDAEWNIQHVLADEYSAKFTWVSNDTGPGQTELPFTSKVAQWIYDYQGRMDRGEGRTVGITVDHTGARWSGILDKFAVEQRSDGDVVLVVDWVHDYEHLKFYSVVPNPVLPDAFQFPRAWLLAGPVTWTLRMSLFMAIWREHNPTITWPDDPMDFDNWASMGLDVSNWHIVVKPESFVDALASGVVWSVATARWTNFHDMAYQMVEDAEITITCTRYLPGDDLPWEGASLRYGTLVVDFVDKSGILVGTSHGGSVLDGLTRTVVEFADDFIDSTLDVVGDADSPDDYFAVGSRYTNPQKPYVIFHEGETSPVQSSSWVYSPSKAVQVECGGKSAPGVNEAISACLAGDSVIDGPDGKERIDVLAERGEPFRVWSLTLDGRKVPAVAEKAFSKGVADLFEYRLANGDSIKATGEHRWFTPDGWKRCNEAMIGTKVGVDTAQGLGFAQVESITALGEDEYFDMHVPGPENYLAHGIWNHNTIQAAGDILGNLAQIGSLGGSIDSMVSPLYTDCVDFDTVIDGPDGKERIGVLAERGGPFRVWSRTEDGEQVPAWAVTAFKKGRAELFEYVLDSGQSITVTKQHRWWTRNGWDETGNASVGTEVGTIDGFSPVVSIQSVGVRDFYDMHVPGTENYLAHGIWNHNTILAWQTFKSNERANNTGWDRLFGYFQDGGNKAFTISALLVLRAAMWATKTVISWKVQVSDGAPYTVGQHFFLDDRVGLVIKGDTNIHMDRCRKLELAWEPETPPEWQISIGDDRIFEDPAQRALGRIERLVAGLHDLGVW